MTKFFSMVFVLAGGTVQAMGHDGTGYQIEGEIDIHLGDLSMVVAVCGEGIRVGLWHDLTGCVFNKDALDRAVHDHSGEQGLEKTGGG